MGKGKLQRFFASRFEPVRASPEWRERVGQYLHRVEEGETPVLRGLAIEMAPTGGLRLRPLLAPGSGGPEVSPNAFVVRPLSDSTLVVEGLGRVHATRLRFDSRGDLYAHGVRFIRNPRPEAPR
jgi:hypothetical protein